MSESSQEDDIKLRAMHQMVSKYIQTITPATADAGQQKDPVNAKVVIVTGTTGALGSHILAGLMNDSSVKHVYALNRKGAVPVYDRQVAEFKKRGILNVSLEKVSLMEADTTADGFGLSSNVYEEVRYLLQLFPNGIHSEVLFDR